MDMCLVPDVTSAFPGFEQLSKVELNRFDSNRDYSETAIQFQGPEFKNRNPPKF